MRRAPSAVAIRSRWRRRRRSSANGEAKRAANRPGAPSSTPALSRSPLRYGPSLDGCHARPIRADRGAREHCYRAPGHPLAGSDPRCAGTPRNGNRSKDVALPGEIPLFEAVPSSGARLGSATRSTGRRPPAPAVQRRPLRLLIAGVLILVSPPDPVPRAGNAWSASRPWSRSSSSAGRIARSLGRGVAPALFGAWTRDGRNCRLHGSALTVTLSAIVALRIAGLDAGTLAVGGAFTAVVLALAPADPRELLRRARPAVDPPVRVGDRVRLRGGPMAGQVEGIVSSLGLFYTTLDRRGRPGHGPEQLVLQLAVIPLREPERDRPSRPLPTRRDHTGRRSGAAHPTSSRCGPATRPTSRSRRSTATRLVAADHRRAAQPERRRPTRRRGPAGHARPRRHRPA